jgi:uncharacterized protein (DUF1778 family)
MTAKTAARTHARSKARLEARIDAELEDLILQAADRLHVTKTAFITDAIREAALKVIARTEVTMMSAQVYDEMIASIDVADASPELESLAAMPRRITK